ncbi:MAG: hypothetical protein V3T31_08175 [candidate division Zixibacteria bacterium]
MKRWLIITYGCTLAVLLIWFFAANRPLAVRQTAIDSEITATGDRLATYSRIVDDLPAIVEQKQRLDSSRQYLESTLFSKEDILLLIHQIDKQVRSHDLSIVDITPPVEELLLLNEAHTDPSKPLYLNLTLTLDGTFLDFGQYIQTLERADYFQSISRCGAASKDAYNDKVAYTVSFRAMLGSVEESS